MQLDTMLSKTCLSNMRKRGPSSLRLQIIKSTSQKYWLADLSPPSKASPLIISTSIIRQNQFIHTPSPEQRPTLHSTSDQGPTSLSRRNNGSSFTSEQWAPFAPEQWAIPLLTPKHRFIFTSTPDQWPNTSPKFILYTPCIPHLCPKSSLQSDH